MNRKTTFAFSVIVFSITFSLLLSCNTGNQYQKNSGPGDNLPSEWGNSKNVRWSYDLAGRGWSSPVIFGDKVIINYSV